MAYPQLVSAAEFDVHVMPSTAFVNVATPTKDAALLWASSVALGFVMKRKVLPLKVWGADLQNAVAKIAAYELMGKRGYKPDSGSNGVIRLAYDDAMAWLLLVSKGLTELIGCIDSSTTPAADEAGPLAAGDELVNWNYQTRNVFGRGTGGGYCGGGDGLG
jgi:phage gp36-like protein